MPANFRFWRNVALIGAAHVVVIVGLIRWNRDPAKAAPSIVWMNAGLAGSGTVTPPPAKEEHATAPVARPEEEKETRQETLLASARSEIQLPVPTPTPTPTPRPTPRTTPTATPIHTPKPEPSPKIKSKPSPTPTPTPKPKPKPKPKPSPKPSPKKLTLVKASSTPKPKPLPEKKHEDAPAPVKAESVTASTPAQAKTTEAMSTSGASGSGGSGSHGLGGGAIQAHFGWYGSMLHDRFYSEWVQPTNVAAAGAKNSVLAKLRIEKDGRISSFEIVRSSGNTAIDDSVRASAKRVTQVDPLPAGLGGDHYDVKINFELNSD